MTKADDDRGRSCWTRYVSSNKLTQKYRGAPATHSGAVLHDPDETGWRSVHGLQDREEKNAIGRGQHVQRY